MFPKQLERIGSKKLPKFASVKAEKARERERGVCFQKRQQRKRIDLDWEWDWTALTKSFCSAKYHQAITVFLLFFTATLYFIFYIFHILICFNL